MNEQLVVKNFGPIKDATVDFKRVTVFIGPTGGGKSTLAKLAAMHKGGNLSITPDNGIDSTKSLSNYGLLNFVNDNSNIAWTTGDNYITVIPEATFKLSTEDNENLTEKAFVEMLNSIFDKNPDIIDKLSSGFDGDVKKTLLEITRTSAREAIQNKFKEFMLSTNTAYIPSERIFVSGLEYSWPGLMRDDIGISKLVLDFANRFSLSRKDILELDIPFLNVKYKHIDGRDFIKIPEREEPLMLLETASGIQSVTPLLVLLEHLSRNTEQAQSFIIEEPELNLYPTAQRDFVYTLLEKCTQGENDLTITTHSPYVLSALNLALYANKVATLFPHQRKKVAKLIPEKYWLKAEEFSAYFVAKGGAKSIFDTKTGLLSESQLDEVSGEFADVFDRLTDLRVPEKKAVAKAKPARK
ncbi:MAG: ATP-binding protein [Bacteroidota bacterium]|nr:ATP-binding protein [Bacteroidota bacterium]